MSHGQGGEGKDGGRRGRDRDRESVSVSQDFFFIENNPMFPCWYSHTNTPTASRPLTEHLDRGDKSFRKKKEPTRARVCARRMRRLVERRKN